MSDSKKEFKNNPFEKLKSIKTSESKKVSKSGKKIINNEKPQKTFPSKKENPKNEFLNAMDGVKPINKGKKKNLGKSPKEFSLTTSEQSMEELLDDHPELVFDPEFSDEFQEFKVSGLSKKEFSKLKKGDYPPEAHLDLHGLTVNESETATREFVMNSSKNGKRVILLITGRGKGSEGGISVLKTSAPKWLLSSAIRSRILAFCSARQKDGGLGALYILLRKNLTPHD